MEKDRRLFVGSQESGWGQDRGCFEVLHRRSVKEDRELELDNAFARQGQIGCNRSLIIDEERLLHELKCWEIRTLQVFW